MFLHHARSPLLVLQEKLKTFNIGQAFVASISLGIWGIHLARWHPFGLEPDCKSCHVITLCKVTSTSSLGKAWDNQCWRSIWGIHFTENLGHPFGWEPDCKSYHVSTSCNSTRGHPFAQEPDCESCHVSMSHKVTSTSSSGKTPIGTSGKAPTVTSGKAYDIQCLTSIWSIHFTGNLGHPFGWDPDCESCHVSTLCKITSTGSSGKA